MQCGSRLIFTSSTKLVGVIRVNGEDMQIFFQPAREFLRPVSASVPWGFAIKGPRGRRHFSRPCRRCSASPHSPVSQCPSFGLCMMSYLEDLLLLTMQMGYRLSPDTHLGGEISD